MEINKKLLRNIFVGVAICILLYWLLHEEARVKALWASFVGIISPFVLGAGLAFILNVPMRGFEKLFKGIKSMSLRRGIALVLTIIVMLLVLALVFWLLIPQLIATIQSLIPQLLTFFRNAEVWVMDFIDNNPQMMDYIMNNADFQSFDWSKIIEKTMSVVSNSLSSIANRALSAIGSVAGALVNAVVAIVFAIYALFRKEILARQARRLLYALVPEAISDQIVRIMRLTNTTFSNFLSGQCIEVLILGVMFAVSMAIFRMPYIPLVSVLIAVTAFVPVVGGFVGCFFGAFFIFVGNPVQAIWFVVLFLVLQQIEGNLIYPKVVGDSIGLPGMWVLVAITLGGELMGVAGMFLMIPIASVIYTLLREFADARLKAKGIPQEKLQYYPPDLDRKFGKKRKKDKELPTKEEEPEE